MVSVKLVSLNKQTDDIRNAKNLMYHLETQIAKNVILYCKHDAYFNYYIIQQKFCHYFEIITLKI